MPTPPSPPPPRSGRPCCPSWRRPPMALSDHPRYPLLFGPSPAHRLDRLTQPPGGADVRLVKAGFGIGFKESWEAALAEIEARGGKPYAIPAGASDHPLGGLGFPGWVEEDGARPRRVLGVDASAKAAETRDQVLRIAQRTGQLIGLRRRLSLDDVELDERYHAGVYGIPDETTIRAMETAARTEGMVTDPVYEGKSMAATIDLVGRREIDPSSTVLYAHLGGQPALNGHSALFS